MALARGRISAVRCGVRSSYYIFYSRPGFVRSDVRKARIGCMDTQPQYLFWCASSLSETPNQKLGRDTGLSVGFQGCGGSGLWAQQLKPPNSRIQSSEPAELSSSGLEVSLRTRGFRTPRCCGFAPYALLNSPPHPDKSLAISQ